MRPQATENLLKLILNELKGTDDVTLKNLRAKGLILLDRSNTNSSVIRELVNQTVELEN